MASVHPSRLGLVPPAGAASPSLPPRPSADTVNAALDSSMGTSASREDELKKRLLARRLQRSARESPIPPSAGSSTNEGYRGKELMLPEDSGPSQRSGTDSNGEPSPASASRDGEVSGLRIKGRGFQKDSDRSGSSVALRRPHIDRVDMDVTLSPQRGGSISSRTSRDDTPDLTSRPRTRSPIRRSREESRNPDDDRRRTRSPRPDPSPRRRYEQDEEAWRQREARGPRRNGDYASPRHDERRYGQRHEDQTDPRRSDGPDSRDGSRHASPSYRRHDLPPHIPPPSMQARSAPHDPPQMLPPIWMNAGMAMPPFPPTRSRNENRNDGRIGPMNLDQRREEREKMSLSIWPPSPDRPWQDPDEIEEERRAKRKEKKRSKKSKRRSKYSSSDSESSDSEYERRRRRRKEKRRERERRRYSDEESEEEEYRKSRRSSERKRYNDDESDGERSRSKKRSRRSKSHTARTTEAEDEATQWVEKDGEKVHIPSEQEITAMGGARDGEDDDGEEVGPRLPTELSGKDRFKAHYSGMLYGEAEAMAAYAADGRRIPRRGEIGLDSARIEEYEAAGYVMSGNRHKRMNAVRLRKENQVINAEEKRAILKLQREEKVRKEGAIVSQFREMLDEKLREGRKEEK